jgi:hypothetical protein
MRPILFHLKSLLFCGFLYLAFTVPAKAQTGTENKVLIVSPHVGEVIDIEDRNKFGLFSFVDSASYMVSRFLLYPDGRLVLEIMRKNGKVEYRPYTQTEFDLTSQLIQAKAAAMVAALKPTPAAPPQPAAPAPLQQTKFGENDKVYYVILANGEKMFVTIRERLEEAYVFNVKYGSPITVPFDQVRYLKPAEKGIGNKLWVPNPHDSRMFFGPTGRGIPKGEGYVQFIDLYLVSANVGITDNFSIGGMATIIPVLPLESQILFFTPKLSFKTSPKTSLSTGVLFANAFGTSFGLLYTAGTYGNANDHVTAGLGFGFMNESIGQRPVLMLGGVKRVSDRIGLMTENYFVPIRETDRFGQRPETLAFGLYGLRLIWPKANLDLGAGYAVVPQSQAGWDGQRFYSTYVLPIFYSYSIRFGNRKHIGKVK